MIQMLQADCMAYMAKLEDKSFDLAIVDPPYGLQANGNHSRMNGSGKLKNRAINRFDCDFDKEAPTSEYFEELFRISKNQIIWGGNYFPLPPTRGIIYWDKEQPWPNFSQWEMAWSSFDKPAKIFRFNNRGASGEGPSIHPTQKPVALYKWLVHEYAKPGDRIIDTHGGSGSICLACHDLGFDIVWMERDPNYYATAKKRYEEYAAQGILL